MPPKYINKLEGKSILVVGGTSGIGFAIAEASVEFGARVVVASRTRHKIDRTIQRLVQAYPEAAGRVRGYPVDLHSDDCETGITALFEFVTNGGRDPVDHVAETAGEVFSTSMALRDTTPASIADFCRTRFIGAAVLAKVAERYLRRAHTSSFTMTCGAGAFKPVPGFVVGASVSGAKDALARSLAVEMKPVRVNLVSAGAVRTELLEHTTKNLGMDQEAALEMFRGVSLLDRVGDPEDLAEAYLSLMKNHFVTGITVHVDGGMVLK